MSLRKLSYSDLDLCLEVVSRSCQPLFHTLDVEYLGTVRDRGLVPKDH